MFDTDASECLVVTLDMLRGLIAGMDSTDEDCAKAWALIHHAQADAAAVHSQIEMARRERRLVPHLENP